MPCTWSCLLSTKLTFPFIIHIVYISIAFRYDCIFKHVALNLVIYFWMKLNWVSDAHVKNRIEIVLAIFAPSQSIII